MARVISQRIQSMYPKLLLLILRPCCRHTNWALPCLMRWNEVQCNLMQKQKWSKVQDCSWFSLMTQPQTSFDKGECGRSDCNFVTKVVVTGLGPVVGPASECHSRGVPNQISDWLPLMICVSREFACYQSCLTQSIILSARSAWKKSWRSKVSMGGCCADHHRQ